jgi:hypothetical protein
MIRLCKQEMLSSGDHSEWQATWNDDERVLACCPSGYWMTLVRISQAKRLLLLDMPADLRLRCLEILHKMIHDNLSLAAMQRVEPACDTAMQMLQEMEPLSISDKCRLMQKWNVIAVFVNLNPSIIDAIKLFEPRSSREAAA